MNDTFFIKGGRNRCRYEKVREGEAAGFDYLI